MEEAIINCSAAHAIWWKRGQHGQSVLYRSGRVHTWPEGEGSHRAVSDEYIGRTGDRARMFFVVRPDGTVRIRARHAESTVELTRVLQAADSRLRPFSPRRPDVRPPSPQARAADADAAAWEMWQSRGRARS